MVGSGTDLSSRDSNGSEISEIDNGIKRETPEMHPQ